MATTTLPVMARRMDFIIVPGWFADESQYKPMARYLRSKGHSAAVVPLKWYNWLPSLGGRSVRPVLDRIDATLNLVLSRKDDDDDADEDYAGGVRLSSYSFMDFVKEFVRPSNGASPPLELGRSSCSTQGSKIVLVGHSAGGWISRILLGSKAAYDGKAYGAAACVDALVTLGTPHSCTDRLTKRNMDFVNTTYPACAELEESGVRYICVAGRSIVGSVAIWGLWKDFAYQSYELCCGNGGVWGDGVIPLECALALQGADHMVLEGVHHFPGSSTSTNRSSWYGTPEVVDAWLAAVAQAVSSSSARGEHER